MKTFIFTFSLLISWMSCAKDGIGRVVKFRGDVLVKSPDGKVESVFPGRAVKEGDTILSSKASFVKILMSDETLFQLGPKSEFKFDTFRLGKRMDSRQGVYKLVYGTLRSTFVRKTKERTLVVKTPGIAMGVRGTDIVTEVYQDKEKLKTDIGLLSGSIELMDRVTGKTAFMKPGEFFEMSGGIKEGRPTYSMGKMSDKVMGLLNNPNGKNVFLNETRAKFEPRIREIQNRRERQEIKRDFPLDNGSGNPGLAKSKGESQGRRPASTNEKVGNRNPSEKGERRGQQIKESRQERDTLRPEQGPLGNNKKLTEKMDIKNFAKKAKTNQVRRKGEIKRTTTSRVRRDFNRKNIESRDRKVKRRPAAGIRPRPPLPPRDSNTLPPPPPPGG